MASSRLVCTCKHVTCHFQRFSYDMLALSLSKNAFLVTIFLLIAIIEIITEIDCDCVLNLRILMDSNF